jgi:hypothetical protein
MQRNVHLDSSDSASITVVCAWCTRMMVAGGPLVSHGICQSCAGRFEELSSSEQVAVPA